MAHAAVLVDDPAPVYHISNPTRGSTLHTEHLIGSECGLSVSVFSHAASASSVPVYFNENVVSGSAQVALDKKRRISSISAKLHGYQKLDKMQWLDQEEVAHDSVFLEFKQELWKPSNGEAHLSLGTHSWPFEFVLPTQTNKIGKNNRPYDLPPSFNSQLFTDHILYEVVVTIKRDGFFNEDEVLIVPIRFVPRTIAALPSKSLAQSYMNGTPLLGPEDDLAGWRTEKFEIRGSSAKGADEAVVYGELSIPQPAEFPRGYTIPFVVTLRSAHKPSLAKFSEPSALGIYLKRQYVRAKRAGGKDDKSNAVTKGSYWLVADKGDSCTLQGEFPAMLQLGPSFTFRTLSLVYSVTIEPEAFNFEPKSKGLVVSVPVTITYFPAPGVRPRSFAPLPTVSATGAPASNAAPMVMPSLISVS